MVQFDNEYRQIKIKIVYYGPALGGKTTCLQQIHRMVDPQRRTRLYSLNTANDRTLFFDLLALDLGRIRGYRLTLQLYTVPGQVQYNATRRAVLAGADGIVFVADSQVDKREENRKSLENLWENLRANGLERRTMPLVFQYNKRDLDPVLPVEELEADLNSSGLPAFPSVAIRGEGVMEAFAAITDATLMSVADKLGVGRQPQAVERLRQQARSALEPLLGRGTPVEAPASPAADRVTTTAPAVEAGEALKEDDLVQEAVRANVAMTDLNTRLDALRLELQRKVRALEEVSGFARTVANLHDPPKVVDALASSAGVALRAEAVSVLLAEGGPLREERLLGLDRDPLLAGVDETGQPLALTLLEQRRPLVLLPDSDAPEGAGPIAFEAIRSAGFGSALTVPLEVRKELLGLLVLYRRPATVPFEEEDLRTAEILASSGAVAYDAARSWRRLEDVNRDLEAQVAARTAELQESLGEVRRLAAELRARNTELEEAYRQLVELDRLKAELIDRISHELKTPVTSLVTAGRILKRYEDAPPEKSRRFLQVMLAEAEKLEEMIQSVLQASALTAESELEKVPVPAETLLKEAIAPLRDLAQERKVRLVVRVAAGLDPVPVDQEAMRAALGAVVKNAIEFSSDGGEVVVEVRRDRDRAGNVAFVVRDEGVGMPENEVPHAFEPFWQGGNVLTGKPKGLGLGLSIARRVAERHGGTIALESRMGEGTSVVLSVPATP